MAVLAEYRTTYNQKVVHTLLQISWQVECRRDIQTYPTNGLTILSQQFYCLLFYLYCNQIVKYVKCFGNYFNMGKLEENLGMCSNLIK